MNKKDSLIYKPLNVLRELLDKKEISSRQLTSEYIDRSVQIDSVIGAMITPMYEMAIESADKADMRIGKGERGPLLGIPVGIKDNICTKGVLTTAGSKILGNYIPPYNATVIDKLENAGAVIIGKMNMDEFGMGSSCENSAFKITRNPWDEARTPGGSSGGSAAAVASGECTVSLGTDTGGSIRQPASFCNLVGVKPTYGRVSRHGVIAYASSLDQVGAIARDVSGAASLLQVISGKDPVDSTSVSEPVPDYTKSIDNEVKGLRIGIPVEYFSDGLDPETCKIVKTAIKELSDLGCEIVEISLPLTEYAVSAYYICAVAEASSNLARYDGAHYGYRSCNCCSIEDMYISSRTEGFGAEVKRRIMLGTFVLSAGYRDAFYSKALQVRRMIQKEFSDAFRKIDCIITPTSPVEPFLLGELINDPLKMYLSDIYTVTSSLAGLPAMNVPCGFTKKNTLPVGMQIICPHWHEERMFSIGYAYETQNSWCRRIAASE